MTVPKLRRDVFFFFGTRNRYEKSTKLKKKKCFFSPRYNRNIESHIFDEHSMPISFKITKV